VSRRILIAGCGYVGSALAARLVAAGDTVWGLRRSATPPCPGAGNVQANLADPATLAQLPEALDYVFYTTGADGFSEAAYRAAYVDGLANLLATLHAQGQSPRRVFFTSSTGVYPQNDGQWLDEESPATPTRFSGTTIIAGEQLLHAGPFPATVLRLGGIYGPGRVRLIDQVRTGTARRVANREVYLNLIHRDDAASALALLMEKNDAAPLYLGIDNEPVLRNTLLAWIAEKLGAPLPPFIDPETEHEPQRGGNRRFTNARLREAGHTFQYPTWRDGYGALIDAG